MFNKHFIAQHTHTQIIIHTDISPINISMKTLCRRFFSSSLNLRSCNIDTLLRFYYDFIYSISTSTESLSVSLLLVADSEFCGG